MPECWTEAKQAVLAWLEADPTDRIALLRDLRARDPRLCRVVEDLIGRDRTTGHSFAAPLAGAAVQVLAGMAEPTAVGQRVGAYRLVSLIGRGGMGSVYQGVRADRQYDKQVAVKLIRQGMSGDPVMRRRFRRERQTLASLDHANIARLYDGGVTPDGQPYLVMELVDGLPLDHYCDRHRLTVRQRLALFTTVCLAVRDSHAGRIVHGDLKPANILVTGAGVPKLVDFGIARLLNDPGEIHETGVPLATPRYASPEQMRGHTVSASSDIYSLGIILHELLTGQRPYDFPPGADPAERMRVVCGAAPRRPSSTVARGARPDRRRRSSTAAEHPARCRGTTPTRLRRDLRGDLDAIILKAIAKSPADRYASVHDLVDDLERFCACRPVSARCGSRCYVMTTALRRRRWACGGAAIAVAVLLAVSGWYAGSLAGVRRRETTARRSAGQLTDLIEGLLDPLERDGLHLFQDLLGATRPAAAREGDRPAVRVLLDRAAEQVEHKHAGQPEVQASLRTAIARACRYFGWYDQAETHLRRVLEIRDAGDPAGLLRRCATLDQLAGVCMDQGKHPQADALLQHAGALLESAAPGSARALTAALANHQGMLCYQRGAYPKARTHFRRALEHYRALGEAGAASTVMVMSNLGTAAFALGRHDRADAHYAQALDDGIALWGPDDVRVAALLNARATVARARCDHDQAEALCRRALEIRRRHLPFNHPAIAAGLHDLGISERALGRDRTAEQHLYQALHIRRQTLGDDHLAVAATLHELAVLHYLRGDSDHAQNHLRPALAIQRARLGAGHPRTLASLDQLAALLCADHRHEPAVALFRQTLAVRRAHLGPDHPDVLYSLVNLQAALINAGALSEAELAGTEALDLIGRLPESSDPRVAACFINMGTVLQHTGRPQRAEAHYREALRRYQAVYGPRHPRVAALQSVLGALGHGSAGAPPPPEAPAPRL